MSLASTSEAAFGEALYDLQGLVVWKIVYLLNHKVYASLYPREEECGIR